MKKQLCAAVLSALMATTVAIPTASSCYGVRAMGMGGAFIAVADDVQTVYWNPAGLVNVKEPQFGWQRSTNYRQNTNYIDVYEFAMPLEKDKSGIGLHYTNNWETPQFPINEPEYNNYKSYWWTLSYGQKVSDKFSVGINVRLEKDSGEPINNNNNNAAATLLRGLKASAPSASSSVSETTWSTDLGFLYKASPKLSFGIYIQDFSGRGKEANYRPGVAYRPDNKTIIAFDVYNATEAYSSTRQHSIGIEHKATENLALRAGNYHGSMTYGVGVKIAKNTELNFAYMADEFDGQKLIGLQTKF